MLRDMCHPLFLGERNCSFYYPIARLSIIEKWEKYLYRNNKKNVDRFHIFSYNRNVVCYVMQKL